MLSAIRPAVHSPWLSSEVFAACPSSRTRQLPALLVVMRRWRQRSAHQVGRSRLTPRSTHVSFAASTPSLTPDQEFASTRVPAAFEMAKLLTSLLVRAVVISLAASALIVSAALVLS